MSDVSVTALRGLPELAPGDDLAGLVIEAAARCAAGLRDGDVVCVAQKAVSKVEGRSVPLEGVQPSPRAQEIAADEADPRMIELILGESARIVRRRGAFLICETRHGFVCAAAGVDRSNAGGGDVAVLLPLDPDASARGLRDAFISVAEVAVIITDSFGRPFRLGTTGVAVGCAGLAPVRVHTGETDDAGRVLQGTELHVADQIASAAELVFGPFGGVPAVVVRGVAFAPSDAGARAGLMPAERDLFRGARGPQRRLGRVRGMTISDRTKALFDTKALGMLGLVSEDGSAQVTPVWITLDGETPVFNTVTGSPKERNMRRDPRVTLTIVDPADVYRYAELRGHVEFEEGQAAVDTIDALAKKYIGQDTYPWNQPGHVRINCRLVVERELGAS